MIEGWDDDHERERRERENRRGGGANLGLVYRRDLIVNYKKYKI